MCNCMMAERSKKNRNGIKEINRLSKKLCLRRKKSWNLQIKLMKLILANKTNHLRGRETYTVQQLLAQNRSLVLPKALNKSSRRKEIAFHRQWPCLEPQCYFRASLKLWTTHFAMPAVSKTLQSLELFIARLEFGKCSSLHSLFPSLTSTLWIKRSDSIKPRFGMPALLLVKLLCRSIRHERRRIVQTGGGECTASHEFSDFHLHKYCLLSTKCIPTTSIYRQNWNQSIRTCGIVMEQWFWKANWFGMVCALEQQITKIDFWFGNKDNQI